MVRMGNDSVPEPVAIASLTAVLSVFGLLIT